MPEGYWKNRELSRRSVIRGAGLGIAGLSGAVLVGCGGGSDDGGGGGAQPEGTVNRAEQILGGQSGTGAAGARRCDSRSCRPGPHSAGRLHGADPGDPC